MFIWISESSGRLKTKIKGAKVLVEKNIGEERSHSTEVRKERSEAARLIRRGAVRLKEFESFLILQMLRLKE